MVVIEDAPRRGGAETGPDCIAAHLESACTTPQAEALPYDRISSAVLTSVRRSGGLTVDPTNWFCADGQYQSVIADYLVHRDRSHITASYMRFLGLGSPRHSDSAGTEEDVHHAAPHGRC